MFLFHNDIDTYVSLMQVSDNGLELLEPRVESYDNFVPSDNMIEDRRAFFRVINPSPDIFIATGSFSDRGTFFHK